MKSRRRHHTCPCSSISICLMHIKEVPHMRATLNIPDKLIEEVQRLSGQKTKTGAIMTVTIKILLSEII